jgi:hypothetical protein
MMKWIKEYKNYFFKTEKNLSNNNTMIKYSHNNYLTANTPSKTKQNPHNHFPPIYINNMKDFTPSPSTLNMTPL